MQELHDLELLLRSRTPLLIIESQEEPRIVQLFVRLALRLAQSAWQWTVTDGLQRLEMRVKAVDQTRDPSQSLQYIKGLNQTGIFLLLDFHPYLGEPINVRLLKEIAQGYEDSARTLVLVSHALDIPPELRHLAVRFNLRLPDRAGMVALINEEARQWEGRHGHRVKASRTAVKQLADNLLGMTALDARRLIRDAIERDGAITRDDIPTLMQAKYRLLGGDGLIGFEHDTARFSEIAGLNNLKLW